MVINKSKNAIRFIKAVLTNLYAMLFPPAYLQYTKETGRGLQEQSPQQTAEYFKKCFDEYFENLGVPPSEIADYISNKVILEYGPGDFPGVALLFYAWGAKKIYCVDRFPLIKLSDFNRVVLDAMIETLPNDKQVRISNALVMQGNVKVGFNADVIEYIVNKNGLSCLEDTVDIVCSRAVLEHVNDLQATFNDMHAALKQQGIAIHKVDLKSHGLHDTNPLDFLTWPVFLWNLMYSYKGVPNRWRVNAYRKVIEQTHFKLELMRPEELCDQKLAEEIRPYLAKPFKSVELDDLRWLSFWLILSRRA